MNAVLITVNAVFFCVNAVNTYRNVQLFHKNTASYLRWQDRTFLRLRKVNVGLICLCTAIMAVQVLNILILTGRIGGLLP